jgi:hypothetical protein
VLHVARLLEAVLEAPVRRILPIAAQHLHPHARDRTPLSRQPEQTRWPKELEGGRRADMSSGT